MSETSEIYDYAVIGGGVSGCYISYRLSQIFDAPNTVLFEASDQVGGRLKSQKYGGNPEFEAELGGMFFSDADTLVLELNKELGIQAHKVKFSREFLYLRATHLRDKNFIDMPDRVPFSLDQDEEGLGPIQLLLRLLDQIVPDLDKVWPFSHEGIYGTEDGLLVKLKTIKVGEKPLWKWGFWNLADRYLSHEGYLLLRSTLGAQSIFRNSNAFDAVKTLLREIGGGSYYRLDEGYQSLVKAMEKASRSKIEFNMSSILRKVSFLENHIILEVDVNGETIICHARNLILALPPTAIRLIEFELTDKETERLNGLLNTVISIPASKLFLTFESPWWNDSKFGPGPMEANEISVQYTDLPMKQCYYFGDQEATNTPVIMASYADDEPTSFWSELIDEVSGSSVGPVSSVASNAMLETALKQLRYLHPDVKVSKPTGAIFTDWSRPPYGGGWHAWKSGIKSFEMARQILFPLQDKKLYICGEAFSEIQGWVEGALVSAESLIKNHLAKATMKEGESNVEQS